VRVCIATNWDNGKGLQRDTEQLRAFLLNRNHEVVLAHTERDKTAPTSNLLIFLETVRPAFFSSAPRRWIVPNAEWWEATPYLDDIERVLCKTHDALRIFSGLAGEKASFLGWAALDRYDPSVPRNRAFLHVAGGSAVKGTAAVVDAWRRYGATTPPLTLVSSVWRGMRPSRVQLFRNIPDAALRQMQNQCMFHLQPSEYEGFGHVLWEPLSVGAVLVTTGAPPMSDVPAHTHLPVVSTYSLRVATMNRVAWPAVLETIRRLMSLSDGEIADIRATARAAYEAASTAFTARLGEAFS